MVDSFSQSLIPCFGYNEKIGKIEGTKRYFGIRAEKVYWRMERLSPFETTSFHRTLTYYSDTLYRHGLLIGRLLEPKPKKNGVGKFPPLGQVS